MKPTGVNALGDFIGRERDGNRGLLVAVDDGRNKTVAAEFTGGPLTNPFARFGLERVGRMAHGFVLYNVVESPAGAF